MTVFSNLDFGENIFTNVGEYGDSIIGVFNSLFCGLVEVIVLFGWGVTSHSVSFCQWYNRYQ